MPPFRQKKKRFCPSDEPLLYIRTSSTRVYMRPQFSIVWFLSGKLLRLPPSELQREYKSENYFYSILNTAEQHSFREIPLVAHGHMAINNYFCHIHLYMVIFWSYMAINGYFDHMMGACFKGYMSPCKYPSLTTSLGRHSVRLYGSFFLFSAKKLETFNANIICVLGHLSVNNETMLVGDLFLC